MAEMERPPAGLADGPSEFSSCNAENPSIAQKRHGAQARIGLAPDPPPAKGNGAAEPYDPRATFEWAYVDESGATRLRIKRVDREEFDKHGKRKRTFSRIGLILRILANFFWGSRA